MAGKYYNEALKISIYKYREKLRELGIKRKQYDTPENALYRNYKRNAIRCVKFLFREK